ncbi:hypothetical protein C0993_000773 [Termitomyces sp. T159_Od127]|nr:hypothetical protein C0993_000773 [Termitomyces sp. T159_Od127]
MRGLVRHLLVKGEFYHSYNLNRDTMPSALQYILGTHSAATVFPNLQKLYCKVDCNLLQQSMNLLHPGVVNLHVEYLRDRPQFQLSIPVRRLSGLVSLEIGSDIIRGDMTGLSALHALPCLATLVLCRYTATYPVLEVLSRFPALKVIRTKAAPSAVPDCRGHHPQPSPFKDGSFRELTVLTVSGCSHQISEILDDKNFPFYVESLIIESMECMEDPSPSPVYPKIVAKIPAVTKLEFREIMLDVSSPFASLRPFLSYNLTELRVETYMALAYTAAEVEELVQSLSNIKVLSLDPGTLLLCPPYGTFTFNHLPLFARHCPKLSYLGILLDTSYPCDTFRDGTVPFSVLGELNLGASFWSMSLSDGAAASLLLALLLPNVCKLTFETPDHSPFDSVLAKFLTDFVRNRTVRFLHKL